MSAILNQSFLCTSVPPEIMAVPADFVPRIIGADLVRLRSQTVYYILTRMKSAVKTWLDQRPAA